jgi:glycosyltransferase involved in cell wall biosynthesis
VTVAINGRFVLSSFGGARRFAFELTEGLHRLRDDVLLLVPPLPAGTELPNVPTRTIGRSSGPLWEQIELPLWLRTHGRPLLVNPATIAPVFHSPQISVVHDIAPALRPQDFSALFRLQWKLAVRFGMLRRGQTLVTISDASRHEIAEHFGVAPERIEVVYLGADGPAGGEPPSTSDTASSFLVFGRHGAAKNIRAVIDAATHLPDSSPLTVRFIGQLDPALEPYARDKRVTDGRLVWRGRVSDEDLVNEFAGALGFVWPSLHEGFGLPPVEAQRFGVPVIASDIPINREILGDSAMYFPPTDPAALAVGMTRLAEDAALRGELRERGQENASRFTWDETARGWDALIRSHGA